ncbi:MAG: zinc ribbon domain-containing protein [Conexivisphaerales archaeon]
MFCLKCGTQLPDDAVFCYKCGSKVAIQPDSAQQSKSTVAGAGAKSDDILAPSGVTSLKCPSCGAPIAPKFGEMVITCEYCGSSISLGSAGWKSIQKHTMLPIKFADKDSILAKVHDMMDRGLLHRHLQESSVLEEATLSIVPYWIIPVSARTSIIAADVAAEAGTIATTAALMGVLGGFGGGRRGYGFGGGLLEGAVIGSVVGGGGGGMRKAIQMNANYNFPVVALKALTEYQPKDYQFNLDERVLFDMSKIPKGIKVLNGDIGEDAAKYQAKTLVDQLQSQKAHEKYHMIQQLQTEIDVADGELLHAPIWFVRYDHKGNKISLVVDANSGQAINSIGL